MFLQLAHTQLDVYQYSQELALECYRITLECYRITRFFPADEKFAMVQQIRRAALSVHLNIAEGCSRRSKAERIRFFEIARGSVIEIDSAIGIAHKLAYATLEQLQPVGNAIIKNFKILSGMIANNK